MSTLVIKDLPDSIELDRQAMRTITGGYAGPRWGMAGYRSERFQSPLAFATPKLLPPSFEFSNTALLR